MKFVMSYSCGKDSTLALHDMMAQGHKPIALITMFNEKAGRSFFHGADLRMLQAYSDALKIPFLVTPTTGEAYHLEMEKSLRKAAAMGAEAACFGDIDIEDHRTWCEERCRHADLKSVFPLWQNDREENVRKVIDLGYQCLIKSINNTLLPRAFLGKIIDADIMEQMKGYGIDICGENGEYHTLVVDGPIFHNPLPYKTGQALDFGNYSVIEVDTE